MVAGQRHSGPMVHGFAQQPQAYRAGAGGSDRRGEEHHTWAPAPDREISASAGTSDCRRAATNAAASAHQSEPSLPSKSAISRRVVSSGTSDTARHEHHPAGLLSAQMIEDHLVGQREERRSAMPASGRTGSPRRAPAASAAARTCPPPGIDVVTSCEQRPEQGDLASIGAEASTRPCLARRRFAGRRHGIGARREAAGRRRGCRLGGAQSLAKLRDLGGEHGVVLQRHVQPDP